MKTFKIKTETLAQRNTWLDEAGNLVVRPALRSVATPTSGYQFEAAFSLQSPNTGEFSHYLFERSTTTNVVQVRVTDEELQDRFTYVIGVVPDSELVVSYATILDPANASLELLINSPQFTPLYGVIGGGLEAAESQDSVNPNTTALDDIPRGICIGMDGRAIIAKGRNLYVSDAKAPRTFVGVNASGLNGVIYGLHQLPGGNLAVCTDRGVWYLGADNFFSGQVVTQVFEQLSDHQTTDYNRTAVFNGALVGLGQEGLVNVSGDQSELNLSDPLMPISLVDPINLSDYRLGRLYVTDRGPVVSTSQGNCHFDWTRGFWSWWTHSSGIELVGTLTESEGNSLLVTKSRILRALGNSEFSGTVAGTVFGQVPTPPGESRVARYLTTASDSPGNQTTSVRGNTSKAKATPQSGAVAGTAVWGTTTLEQAPLRSRRSDWAIRSDDLSIQLQVDAAGSRIGPAELTCKGVGLRRKTN